jgi:hypothetical protein
MVSGQATSWKSTHFPAFLFVACALLGRSSYGQEIGSLTGTISDQTSAPIAKVSAILYSMDRVLQTESGEDGRFRFPRAPPGAYDLVISANGFVKQKLPIDLSNGDSRALEIVLKVVRYVPDMNYCGAYPLVRYEIANSKGRHLAGIIRGYYDNKPIVNAKIALLRTGEKQPTLKCTSDTFNDPPAGRYTLRISGRGYREGNLRELLFPRENGAFIDFPLLKRSCRMPMRWMLNFR